MIVKGILKLHLLTTENRQPISVILKYLLADRLVPVFYLWAILFFLSYIILNITLLLKINLIKLLEEEYLILSTVSAILIAPAEIPFDKE